MPQQRMKYCLCPLVLFGVAATWKSLKTPARAHTHTEGTGQPERAQIRTSQKRKTIQVLWVVETLIRSLLLQPQTEASASASSSSPLSLSLCIPLSLSHSVSLSVTVLSLAVCLSLWRYGAPARRRGVNLPLLVLLLFSSSFVFGSPSPGCARAVEMLARSGCCVCCSLTPTPL